VAENYVPGSELWPLMACNGGSFHCVLVKYSDYIYIWEIGVQKNRTKICLLKNRVS